MASSSDLIFLKTACCTSKNFCIKNLYIVYFYMTIHSELKIGLHSGIGVDLFKSPSEKRYELTIICQYECSEFQDWEREPFVRVASLRTPLSLLDFAALVSTYYC